MRGTEEVDQDSICKVLHKQIDEIYRKIVGGNSNFLQGFLTIGLT